jgi:Flp pilus assembly protein protease CpaA
MGAGVAGACVLAWLAVLSVYDICERRLPNWLTMPGALVILTAAAALGTFLGAAIGGSLVFDYGFNVETSGDHPAWHETEEDVFPGRH